MSGRLEGLFLISCLLVVPLFSNVNWWSSVLQAFDAFTERAEISDYRGYSDGLLLGNVMLSWERNVTAQEDTQISANELKRPRFMIIVVIILGTPARRCKYVC